MFQCKIVQYTFFELSIMTHTHLLEIDKMKKDKSIHKIISIFLFASFLQNSGSAQFYLDGWVGTTPSLPVCDDTGNPDGTDYSGCYSGWFTDACDLGYDYTSIMHYGLTE